MLTELCNELHNFFLVDSKKDIHEGTYTISGGAISPLDFIMEGQYFRICGSVFNDGVYQKSSADQSLEDEVFDGSVWAMAVPPAVIALAEDIKKFNAENKTSAFTSESFGGYSYTKATNKEGIAIKWQDAFKSELNKWRKIR